MKIHLCLDRGLFSGEVAYACPAPLTQANRKMAFGNPGPYFHDTTDQAQVTCNRCLAWID